MAVEILPELEKEARRRRTGRPKAGQKVSPKVDGLSGRSDAQAAKLVGVSRSLVAAAKAVKKRSGKLFAQVKAGKKKVVAARREIQRDEVATRVPKMPKGKFRVIYADPPWKYGDRCENGAVREFKRFKTVPELGLN